MFALASPTEGQCTGTARQRSTAVSVCSALKAWAQLLQGIQVTLHLLSITAINARLCLGVSLRGTFPYSAHPQVGLERGACSKPSWGKEKDLSWGPGVLGSFCGAPRLCSMSCNSVSTRLPPASLPVPTQSRDPQTLACDPWCCWPRDEIHSVHQISALPPRQRRWRKNKGKQKHRTLTP